MKKHILCWICTQDHNFSTFGLDKFFSKGLGVEPINLVSKVLRYSKEKVIKCTMRARRIAEVSHEIPLTVLSFHIQSESKIMSHHFEDMLVEARTCHEFNYMSWYLNIACCSVMLETFK